MHLAPLKPALIAVALLSLLLALARAVRAQDLAAPVPAVNVQDRQAVEDLFNDYLRPQLLIPSGFTGSVTDGDPGRLSDACMLATLASVNFNRALAGVPGDVISDPALSAECQQAALMMAARGALSHYPDPSWPFYTAEGAMAAAHSNLGLGDVGPGGIGSYMEDPGSTNAAVGHRRWILYPVTDRMGYGGVDATPGGPPYLDAADALWVIGHSTRPGRPTPRDGFVAWPSPGWFPVLQGVLPGRWSFSLGGGADLSSATATVSREDGLALRVTPEIFAYGYGEPTLVWQLVTPAVAPNLRPEVVGHVYTVTVAGVRVGGAVQSFTYQVRPFIPGPTSVAVTALRGNDGYFFFGLIRIGGDPNATLTVNFKVGGAAVAGADYSPLGDGNSGSRSVTIPAGQGSTSVSFQALAGGDPNHKVKLHVLAGEGYVPGTPAVAKIKVGTP